MRKVICGIACGVLLVLFASGGLRDNQAWGQRHGAAGGEVFAPGALQAFATQLGNGHQQLVVLEPQRRVMGVYHVDATSGEISLKSIRNIYADLEMLEYNGTAPFPQDVRSMLDRGVAGGRPGPQAARNEDSRSP